MYSEVAVYYVYIFGGRGGTTEQLDRTRMTWVERRRESESDGDWDPFCVFVSPCTIRIFYT